MDLDGFERASHVEVPRGAGVVEARVLRSPDAFYRSRIQVFKWLHSLNITKTNETVTSHMWSGELTTVANKYFGVLPGYKVRAKYPCTPR